MLRCVLRVAVQNCRDLISPPLPLRLICRVRPRFTALQKYVPLDLRHKKTRALRLALSKRESKLETNRAKVARQNFPKRTYALKA